ncbi:hypothetical protein P5G65_04930 [Paenibacillus chondroitinus]|uniref:Tail fiber protein n=1 Tax=Paenibacillus chondroitinus TaxID=59842 RepID=A0ABU6D672_9BACL|nr:MULTISPECIES: hypothetical protein [Paenibacillus]MCY9658108.1 hypothetical protein [Paenibacillus anseongense]MEB4793230.1 hypothetical protein [Paenibacillus chondroitinus]
MANPTTPNLNLNKIDRSSPTTTFFNTKTWIDDNMDILDVEVTKMASSTQSGRMSAADFTKLQSIAASAGTAGSASDSVIGTRIIDDTVTAAAGADTPTRLWSKLANMIKGITGELNWYTLPVTSIKALKTALDNIPAPSWSNLTGKPSTFPPSTHGHAATEITATGSTTVQAEIDSLKSSVSSGKSLLATAITGKNQPTSASAAFAQMVANINAISSDATASAGDILAGKTAYVGSKLTGTMPNYAGVSVEAGNVGSDSAGNLWLNPSANGYLTGSSAIHCYDPNLIPSSILRGRTVLGVAGTVDPIREVKGTAVSSSSTGSFIDLGGTSKAWNYITITGLSFIPKYVMATGPDSSFVYYTNVINGQINGTDLVYFFQNSSGGGTQFTNYSYKNGGILQNTLGTCILPAYLSSRTYTYWAVG